MGIIIDIKYAHDGNLDAACKKALKQIEYTRYENDLSDDGIENILKDGIACYKKRCKVILKDKQPWIVNSNEKCPAACCGTLIS